MTKLSNYIISFNWLILFFIILIIMMNPPHPIYLMMLMITHNILICIFLSIWKFNYIFSFLMFIIMISGLLIIFMYFSSLISNEQFLFKFNFFLFLIFSFNMIFLFNFMNKFKLMILNNFNFIMKENLPLNFILTNDFLNISLISIHPLSNLTFMSILFILLTFISIIKINSSSHSFPMRKIK